MDHHLERNKIYALLDESGLDQSRFVVGASQTYNKGKRRYEFNAGGSKKVLEDTAQYAIRYFQDQDVYLVWNIKVWNGSRKVYRTCFSVSCKEVEEAIRYKLTAQKAVEYSGWGTEGVLVLTYEELKNFVSGLASDKHE